VIVTLKRSKARLAFTSVRRGHEWFWSDPGVKEAIPDPEPTLRQVAEEIKQTVEQTVRQVAHVPAQGPSDKQTGIDNDVIERMMAQKYVPPPPRPPMPNICDVSRDAAKGNVR
jgi:hypothetical protein